MSNGVGKQDVLPSSHEIVLSMLISGDTIPVRPAGHKDVSRREAGFDSPLLRPKLPHILAGNRIARGGTVYV